MEGGAGDDIYVVDNAGDRVIEAAGAGNDSVQSSIAFSLAGQGIEHLTLTGTAVINGTGSELANRIIGNTAANLLKGLDGADTLDGGGGADTMEGGAGDDIYVVDNAGDRVIEAAGAGTDFVQSSVSFSLAGQAIEHLTLTGTAVINGTGNELANRIRGNAAANVINGGIGDDTLIGGAGADTLTGDAGRDLFYFGAPSEGGDVILGYSVEEDYIFISGSGFGGVLEFGQDLWGFGYHVENDTGEAILTRAQFIFETDAARLWWDVDGVGGVARVLIATLPGVTSLRPRWPSYQNEILVTENEIGV
jgi:Ca2+-binding RTX toxin-like protein